MAANRALHRSVTALIKDDRVAPHELLWVSACLTGSSQSLYVPQVA